MHLESNRRFLYCDRFHNVIREEYTWEKEIVEARLKTWKIERLTKEGFSILNLRAAARGNLFQEKVRDNFRSIRLLPYS